MNLLRAAAQPSGFGNQLSLPVLPISPGSGWLISPKLADVKA
jgi:hypothetical protein